MSHIPRVVCGCGHEMSIAKNGFVLQANTGSGPYYKVASDKYVCKNCLTTVCLPAREVLCIQHEERFARYKHDAEFNFA